ncbi:MAG: F0F1 ATP synthase subunit A, partial [Myxococcales bacterium]|nr:F0F1 ATP synthase subunit A [Myxococcales bacterium]
MDAMTPTALLTVGPLVITDTVVTSAALSVLLAGGLSLAVRMEGPREALEVVYETLEGTLRDMVTVDVAPLVPLILTQWAFIAAANLVGVLPIVASPTRDLSLTAALAVISLGAGHVYGFRAHGWRYLKSYV